MGSEKTHTRSIPHNTHESRIKTVPVNCYNCGSDESSHYGDENGFTMVKCDQCGLLYVTPQPCSEEISLAHQCGEHKGELTIDQTGRFSPRKVKRLAKIMRHFSYAEPTNQRRTWIDIGCGHGELLVALRKISGGRISSYGIEPNAYKRASALRRGLEVDYFNINEHERKYDVVSLLNVWSHLPNPPEFLKACRNLLKPKGELLIQTGDAAHLSANEMCRPMMLPDHLSFASQEIVVRILNQLDFEVVAISKYHAFSRHPIAIVKELIKFMWPGKASGVQYLFNPKYKTDMFIRARAVS